MAHFLHRSVVLQDLFEVAIVCCRHPEPVFNVRKDLENLWSLKVFPFGTWSMATNSWLIWLFYIYVSSVGSYY
jgi:hypothetical protein